MNKFKAMFYLLILLILNISCIQIETDKRDIIVPQTNNVTLSLNTQSDTLLFTSGIHAIFQDSKGNYWFGSHQEGVCLFDGEKFTYFTVNDGLSDNQIRSIQEDLNGNIWFGTSKGVSSYDGKEIINHTSKSFSQKNQPLQSEWKKTENDLWFNAGNNSGVYR